MRTLKICFVSALFFLTISANTFAKDRDAEDIHRFVVSHPQSNPAKEFLVMPDVYMFPWGKSDGKVIEGFGGLIKNNSKQVYTAYPLIRTVLITDTGSQSKPIGYLDTDSENLDEITNNVGIDGELEPGFRKRFVLLFKNIDPAAKSLTLKVKDIVEPDSHETYILTATYVRLSSSNFKKIAMKWSSSGADMPDVKWQQLFKKVKQQWGLTSFSFKPQRVTKLEK